MPLFLAKAAFRNLMSICGLSPAKPREVVDGSSPVQVQRTPEEAKIRRRAYRRRKAARAARRRNRR